MMPLCWTSSLPNNQHDEDAKLKKWTHALVFKWNGYLRALFRGERDEGEHLQTGLTRIENPRTEM